MGANKGTWFHLQEAIAQACQGCLKSKSGSVAELLQIFIYFCNCLTTRADQGRDAATEIKVKCCVRILFWPALRRPNK